jgi:hypothetical protein
MSPPSNNPFALSNHTNVIPVRFRVDTIVHSIPQNSSTINPTLSLPGESDGSPAYKMEGLLETRIKNVKQRNGKWKRAVQWLVKWKEYPQEDATWEEEERLRSDLGEVFWGKMVRQFERRTAERKNSR